MNVKSKVDFAFNLAFGTKETVIKDFQNQE